MYCATSRSIASLAKLAASGCCAEPCLTRMCASGIWGLYCLNCHTFIPEG